MGHACPGVSPSCSVRLTYQPFGPSLCPWKPQLTPLAVTACPRGDGARSPRATAPPRATRTIPGAAPVSPQPAHLETQPEVQIRHSLNLVWPPKSASLEQPARMDKRLPSPAPGTPEQSQRCPSPEGLCAERGRQDQLFTGELTTTNHTGNPAPGKAPAQRESTTAPRQGPAPHHHRGAGTAGHGGSEHRAGAEPA